MSDLPTPLPIPFLTQMHELLGDEYNAFLAGYNEPPRRGLRFNLLKCDVSNRLPDLGIGPLSPVPWCKEGYQYPADARPAKNFLYNAGLFYIQEPSAMSPAAILSPRPGERLLDICAAPGGKSVQLAGYMQGQGVLVSNDISPSRSRALVKNLEMAGVTNAIVLTEKPNRLAERFQAFFDCILVDAPCSGEGMFRRDPDAAKAYTTNKPEACAAMQQEILRHAAVMLRPGGRMVYSTCTFNPLENEGAVSAFLSAHSDFELLPIDHNGLGLYRGRGEWANTAPKAGTTFGLDATSMVSAFNRTARIWPHISPGEGHFIALMTKAGDQTAPDFRRGAHCASATCVKSIDTDGRAMRAPTSTTHIIHPREIKAPGKAERISRTHERLPEEFIAFCDEALNTSAFENSNQNIHRHNNSLFLQPENLDLSGLRVARSGWLLGECAKGRFVPSQALAMGITKAQARYAIDLPELMASRYLKGESLIPPEDFNLPPGKPWVLICYSGLPLGWGRLVQGRIKNQLPSGWVVT